MCVTSRPKTCSTQTDAAELLASWCFPQNNNGDDDSWGASNYLKLFFHIGKQKHISGFGKVAIIFEAAYISHGASVLPSTEWYIVHSGRFTQPPESLDLDLFCKNFPATKLGVKQF